MRLLYVHVRTTPLFMCAACVLNSAVAAAAAAAAAAVMVGSRLSRDGSIHIECSMLSYLCKVLFVTSGCPRKL